jgi:hypothetical protein
MTRIARLVALLAVLAVVGAAAQSASAAPSSAGTNPVPVLAYYYIWFDPSSWLRAKRDYPLLGPYSSSDLDVLDQHVVWAKQAGIQGFVVSWKSTPKLNRRLSELVTVADRHHFKLAVIYQGLDFDRNPLPARRVAHDLRFFAWRFASDPAFRIFEKPLVVWSGTWKFSTADIRAVTTPLRKKLLILASEKNVADYLGVRDAVDGDAYYWSSVNPQTYPGYPEKLAAMSRAVHERGGLWIAPAATGFDARLIGGRRVVPRGDGATLRREVGAAVESSPDAIGLISWNEFSENSHVEPSVRFGHRYLNVLAEMQHTQFHPRGDIDSSSAVTGIGYGLPILSGLGGVVFAALLVAFTRRHVNRNHRRIQTPRRQGGSTR